MLRYKLSNIKQIRQGYHLELFAIYLLIIGGLLVSLTSKTVLADQYKSFVIIEQKKQTNNLLTTPELLAQNLDNINQSQRAIAERFLARHFVEQKQYHQAINFYLQALTNKMPNSKTDSDKSNNVQKKQELSIYAKQQILEELSYVYLLNQQYQQVLNTLNQFQKVTESLSKQINSSSSTQQLKAYQLKENKRIIRNTLIRAQAHFYLNQYETATLTLNKVFSQAALNDNLSLTQSDVEQALYFYYHMQAHLPAVVCLNYLLYLTPNNKSYWQTLTHVYHKMALPDAALNTLVLAEKQLTKNQTMPLNIENTGFDQANYDWLISLYVENKLYFQAASKLSQLLKQQRYPNKAQSYYQLFSLWFHAKEFDLALQALKTSAQLQQSSEYFIQLGQLHLQQNNWFETEEAVLNACKIGLEDEQVGMANLLLGVQFANRGEREQAKLAFYNANLMGGSMTESAQWLRYLNNGKADKNVDPYRRFTGLCLPKSEVTILNLLTSISQSESRETKQTNTIEHQTKPEKVQVKEQLKTTIKITEEGYFYGVKIETTPEEMQNKIFRNALRINKALLRKQKKINGSLQMLIDNQYFYQNNKMYFTLAMPTNSKVMRSINIRPIKMLQYRAYSYIYTGEPTGIITLWKKLYQHAIEQGDEPSGKNRLIFLKRNDNGDLELELLLGLL